MAAGPDPARVATTRAAIGLLPVRLRAPAGFTLAARFRPDDPSASLGSADTG